MQYQFVSNNQQLAQLCQQATTAEVIVLDTEFIRTRTYYPQVGLIQLNVNQHVTLIDPLTISDWQPFIALLNHPEQTKYLHACSEDLDVFAVCFQRLPAPLLDSQILAAFLDNPLNCGYAALVEKYLHVKLDKSETRTDWLKRPLTLKQQHYAAADVYYLLPLMQQIIQQVKAKGWLAAARQECQALVQRKAQVLEPQFAYQQIKNCWQLKGEQLTYLQRLAAWRLNYARQHNIALNFIVPEDLLFKLARLQPKSKAELSALGMQGPTIRRYGETLLNLLQQPLTTITPPIVRANSYPGYKKCVEHIKQFTQQLAKQTGLSEELLVSRRLINQYILWLQQGQPEQALPELLSGWRGELFKDLAI